MNSFRPGSLRRRTSTSLCVLVALAVAFMGTAPAAGADVLPVVGETPITLISATVSAAEVLAGIVSIPAGELATLALAVAPRQDLPHQLRAAAGSEEYVVFVDYYFDDAATAMYAVGTAVNRTTLSATELVISTLTRSDDGTLSATAVSDNRETEVSSTAAFGPECTACSAGGIVAGAAFGATVCVGLGPVGSLVCGIGGGLFGAGATIICQDAAGCNNPARPEMSYQYQRCGYTSCFVQVQIQNSGRQLISLGYQVYWTYPGFTCATRGTSSCVVTAGENATFPLIPAVDLGRGGQVYAYEFFSATPGWTRCAATVMVSITAQWSDYSFRSTGYVNGPKLFATDCPGYRSTI